MSVRSFLYALLFFYLVACKNRKGEEQPVKIERDGVNISYTSCGEHDTTLLFIHGWGINKEYWEPQIKHFCIRFRVVAMDLPGFGQSGTNREKWNFDEYANDVKAVIDQLKLKNVILIGHSMSGDLILNFANKYPSTVTGLIGIDNLHEPAVAPGEQERQKNDSFFNLLSTRFDSTIQTFKKIPFLFRPSTDTSIVNRVIHDLHSCDSVIATQVLRSLADISGSEQQMMQHLPSKLYLVNGEVLPTKLDSLNKYCKWGCEVIIVHGTGHYPMVEKPDEFNAALEKVLAAISNERKE